MIEDPHHLLFQGRHPAGEMGHGIDVLLEDVLLDGGLELEGHEPLAMGLGPFGLARGIEAAMAQEKGR